MYSMQRLIIVVLVIITGCNNSNTTPPEYRNATLVPHNIYSEDSLAFIKQIQELVESRESGFYPISYSYTSQIYIDTLIYSPNRLKAVFFVILKKPNSAVVGMNNYKETHFDAKAFLAERTDTLDYWDIRWFRIMNLNRYPTYDLISKKIHQRYFIDLIKIKNHEGESRYKYNLGDIRFWDGPVWDQEIQMREMNISGD